ncbi:pitrilysin family protein [Sporosarcina saromensis]|uniref:Pitrilysin family protein n=1 Tax=Sporosarcina saromensis TaxID=359365 RepID=A0ABU4G451_9BACL|nr:pitrilysin family protein [Sporosarcina saromensis]MDW0111732.1 pitrilysin family protein [Sporosarcina saromensis]
MLQKRRCLNGVTIVHEKMPHVRSVVIGICVKVGSSNETASQWGLSHFIEHMLFKGTPTRSAKQIAEQFDRIGGDVNAYTSKEVTCYSAIVLDRYAHQAIDILADMFFNSTFDPKEMEKEKAVILDEIASVEDTPDDDVDERLWGVMYPNDAIGRSIGGSKETIQSFNLEMIEQYMATYYTPENTVISVAGNYDEALIHAIEQHFSAFKARKDTIDHPVIQPPRFSSGQTMKEKAIEQAHVCLGYPGLPLKDERLHDLILLDSIIGGTMSSRLFQQIREELGIAYSVFSYYSSFTSTGAFVIYGGTAPEQVDTMVRCMDEIILDVAQNGVTDEELHNAKEQLKGSFLIGLDSAEARMHRNANNELILGEHRSIDEVVALIEQVQVTHVNRLAREIFVQDRATSVISPNR